MSSGNRHQDYHQSEFVFDQAERLCQTCKRVLARFESFRGYVHDGLANQGRMYGANDSPKQLREGLQELWASARYDAPEPEIFAAGFRRQEERQGIRSHEAPAGLDLSGMYLQSAKANAVILRAFGASDDLDVSRCFPGIQVANAACLRSIDCGEFILSTATEAIFRRATALHSEVSRSCLWLPGDDPRWGGRVVEIDVLQPYADVTRSVQERLKTTSLTEAMFRELEGWIEQERIRTRAYWLTSQSQQTEVALHASTLTTDQRKAELTRQIAELSEALPVALIRMIQSNGAGGQSGGKIIAYPEDFPAPYNNPREWPIDGVRSLWGQSVAFIPGSTLTLEDADGGFIRWLWTKTQKLWSLRLVTGVAISPYESWIKAFNTDLVPNRFTMPVASNPRDASPEDVLRVSEFAKAIGPGTIRTKELLVEDEKRMYESLEVFRQLRTSPPGGLTPRELHRRMRTAEADVSLITHEYRKTYLHLQTLLLRHDVIEAYERALLPDTALQRPPLVKLAAPSVGVVVDYEALTPHLEKVSIQLENYSHAMLPTPAADGTENNQQKPDDPPTEAEFVFRPDGDGYFLKGFGESGHVTAKGAKGMHDLYRLVQKPGELVLMIELEDGPGVKRAERSNQPAMDVLGIQKVREKLREVQADIEKIDSTSPDSGMERRELESERDLLMEELRKVQGKGGKVRDLNASDLNRMKSNIWGRINTVCDRIKQHFPKLSKHFRDATGASDAEFYAYKPDDSNMRWDTESKR